ncbi:EamA family transporter, partial [Salmonella enterica subsp. enterica serovar Braenderup]
ITAMALVLNNLNQRKLAMLATQANTLKASTSH